MERRRSNANTTLVRAIKESLQVESMNGIQQYGFRINIRSSQQVPKTFYLRGDILKALPSINWCRKTCQLLPVITEGDGNCLLHSLSLYMWGIHDRYLLRQKMHAVLNRDTPEKQQFYDQWSHFQTHQHLNRPGGQDNISPVYMDDDTLQYGWREVSHIWSRRYKDKCILRPLENFNIYVMANLLRRPIIVHGKEYVTNKFKEAQQEGAPELYDLMCGIYLPFNVDPSHCVRSPVIICYDLPSRHFMPLMRVCPLVDVANKSLRSSPKCTTWKAAAVDGGCSNLVSLTTPDKTLLNLKFKRDREVDDLELLHRYLNIHWLKLDEDDVPIPCAALNDAALPPQWSNTELESRSDYFALGTTTSHSIAAADLESTPMPVPGEIMPERHVKRPIYVCQTRGCYEALTSTEVVICNDCRAARKHKLSKEACLS